MHGSQPIRLMPEGFEMLSLELLRGFGLLVSQNGKTLAIVQGEWLNDAVLLKGL
jgi:hypothetical protein